MAVKTEHSYSISGGGGGAASSSSSNASNAACASSSSFSSSAAATTAAVANNLYFANGGGVGSNGNGAGSDGDSEPASPLSLEDGEQFLGFGTPPHFEQGFCVNHLHLLLSCLNYLHFVDVFENNWRIMGYSRTLSRARQNVGISVPYLSENDPFSI